MLSWASFMFCWNARAPQPQYNPAWQAVWRERLEKAGESFLKTWLEHQTYDQYWRHGSVCEDYDNIQIPVLLFGGWHDGYTNAAFRSDWSPPLGSRVASMQNVPNYFVQKHLVGEFRIWFLELCLYGLRET